MMLRLFIFATFLLLTGCERERIVFPGDDSTAPLPPAGLRVEGAHDGYIFIGWLKNGENDLRGYVVYRAEGDSASSFAAVDTTTENYLLDVMRSYDSTYYYRVTAIDESGNESAPSPVVSATSPNRYRPLEPYSIAVTGHNIAGRRFLRVEWSPVDEADLAGYLVFRSNEPFSEGDPSLYLDFTTNTFYSDSTAAELNVRRYYAVASMDRGGFRSDLTAADSDIITAAPVPLKPEALGPATSFPAFRWLAVDGVSRYALVISTEEFGGQLWSGVVESAARDTVDFQYFGPGLSVGRTYFWRVATLTKGDTRPNALSDARQFYIVP